MAGWTKDDEEVVAKIPMMTSKTVVLFIHECDATKGAPDHGAKTKRLRSLGFIRKWCAMK
jgi:hypothetical protein